VSVKKLVLQKQVAHPRQSHRRRHVSVQVFKYGLEHDNALIQADIRTVVIKHRFRHVELD
jgi:hypothetical protein